MPAVPPYWSGSPEQFSLIEKVQNLKREYFDSNGVIGNATHSDRFTMINPVTGQQPSEKDLKYAAKHMRELYESGRIREDRWAFLWYH